MSEVPILCGSCRTPAQVPDDATDDFQVACSGCGQTDRLADVMSSAKDHFTSKAGKQFGDTLAEATRGNKFVKFQRKPTLPVSFRWITG
jgi:hypothetical protein